MTSDVMIRCTEVEIQMAVNNRLINYLTVFLLFSTIPSSVPEKVKETVNYLTPEQVYDGMGEIKNNDNLFNLFRESFYLKMDTIKGITKDELDDVIHGIADPDFQNALKNVKLVGESRTQLTLDDTKGNEQRKALVIYEKRNDGKYDVLIVYATQVKKLAKDRLMACGLGSICAGVITGCFTMNPVVGVSTAVILMAGSGAKGAYDYTTDTPNVLYGYILEELVQKNLVKTGPNNSLQLTI